jgi:hypothetical protein
MNDMLAALIQIAYPKGYGYTDKAEGNQSTESYLSRGEDSALGIAEDSEDRVMEDPYANNDPTADPNNQEYGYNQGNKVDKTVQFQREHRCTDCNGHGCKTCGDKGLVTEQYQHTIPADNLRGTRLEQLRYNPDTNQGGAWPQMRNPQRSPRDDPYSMEEIDDDELLAAKPFMG